MKYVYKATGVIVESDSVLDSILFEPVKDIKKEKKTVGSAEKVSRGRKKKVV